MTVKEPSTRKQMNKVRCKTCKKLVHLEDCPSYGYITYRSGFEKLSGVECFDCFNKDFERCLKVLE